MYRLYRQVVDEPVYLLEPVWLPSRNHYDVPFFEIIGLAVHDVFRRHLSWPRGFGLDRGTAGDQSSAPIHDIKNVGLFLVDLNVPIGCAAVGLNAVSFAGNQWIAALLAEILEHLLAFYVDWGLRVCCHRHHTERRPTSKGEQFYKHPDAPHPLMNGWLRHESSTTFRNILFLQIV